MIFLAPPPYIKSKHLAAASSHFALRTGAEDAALLAEQLGLGGRDALLDLPNFAAWARLLKGGTPTSSLRLDLFPAPVAKRHSAHRLLETSRRRFGRSRSRLEMRIREFHDA